MKLFVDTAEIAEIRAAAAWGIIDGVTTNPTLIARSGRPFREVIDDIRTLIDGDISAEVISTDTAGMVEEAREIATWGSNVVVKVPLTEEGIAAVAQVSKRGIRTNVTLCFSVGQALMAAKAGATYVSPFIGRLDEIGVDGVGLIADIVEMYSNYGFKTQVLAASIRHPLHVQQVALAGAHVATCPFKVLQQCFRHPLTDKGLATFLEDHRKAQAVPVPAE
ncbi:MAG TPA: fructose-6-phosphate aldolase [bacterium]|nr:fructose-6-phosphate aldolase [bacterium]